MRVYDLILKKKRGDTLSDNEIKAFVLGYSNGDIPDYQAAALLMAICFQGMCDRETHTLTDSIAKSGDSVDLSEFGFLSADKHSTGGVGDKTTLIVAPLAASLGCKVAKMSGRGLGHTGGTIDKLESIPGYRTALTPNEFFGLVRKHGIAVVGQTGNLAPADKKLYALRDVTATVDCIPLIASSVMGKKLAAGASSIVLDVKYGSGSFMKTPEEAEALAQAMVNIGRTAGKRTSAFITNMNVPLGYAIGNSLEVIEAINTLRGNGPRDLTELCVALAAEMASLSFGIEFDEAKLRAQNALSSGIAFEKFKEWVSAQGASLSCVTDTDNFPKARFAREVKADTEAYIETVNTEKIGLSAMELGAGRKTKDDVIDFSAGIIIGKKVGDKIIPGDVLATLYTNRQESLDVAEKLVTEAFTVSEKAPLKEKLIYKMIKE
ncbi:MAG: thymidine phosphorylase [Clostridia bacterium]|nr:thymidine phosphorylase [Clostridia bacterium]